MRERVVEDVQREERELGLRVVHGAPRKPATTMLRTIYVHLLDEGTDVVVCEERELSGGRVLVAVRAAAAP